MEENTKPKTEKNDNKEKQKGKLLDSIISGNLRTITEKVGFLMSHYVETRNSDKELAWLYWMHFDKEHFDGGHISKSRFLNLTNYDSIKRSRATVQNDFKLFEADSLVKSYRKGLELEKRDLVIEEKANSYPQISVYIDETGKNDKFLAVGGLWIVEHLSSYEWTEKLRAWKKEKKINYEFHFSKCNRNKLQDYKEFFLKFLRNNPTYSFKLILVENNGISSKQEAIENLTYFLVKKGIIHEDESGRTKLPRTLNVFIDDEDKSNDLLKLENIKDRIESHSIDGLDLGRFKPMDSKENSYIQITDLFVASVNRKLNSDNESKNHKDELADYILELIDFNIDDVDNSSNHIGDSTTIFNLTK